jgi:hypothetical protein
MEGDLQESRSRGGLRTRPIGKGEFQVTTRTSGAQEGARVAADGTVTGAVGPGCTRCTAPQIEAYLAGKV